MKKLLELLNEYEKSGLNEFELEEYEEWCYYKWNGKILRGNWENNNELTPYELCSKHYGFIKWLVDNDKIDRESENYPLKKYYPYFNDDVLAIVSQDCNTYEDKCRVCYDKYESLLMLLSIQDNPIEFLISILK